MKKLIQVVALIAISVATAYAQQTFSTPEGFYNSLNGKSGAELKQAVKASISSLNTVSYGDKTWEAFKSTDIRTVDGRDAWFDMYSNILIYEATGHEGMNIEHSVPNSWWGGLKNDAYKDLYHLNPSNSDANNRKNNNPLGIVGNVSWTNGITTIGSPADGTGGGSTTVFEPAQQFKGDFARAYFYVFTLYDDIDWSSEATRDFMYDCTAYPSLKPWAYEMLLKWHNEDPVDSRELRRNEAVAKIQGNRNPFIDIPELASYIWGDNSQKAISVPSVITTTAIDRPAAPSFDGYTMSGLDTYVGRWWDKTTITISASADVTVMYSLDGKNYLPYSNAGIDIEQATSADETVTIRAYAESEQSAPAKASPIATLLLTARDPDNIDFTERTWDLVTTTEQLTEEDFYIIVASKAGRVMLSEVGPKYMSASETPLEFDAIDGSASSIPANAGIVSLVSDSQDGWILSIADTKGTTIGRWTTTAAKAMTISDAGTAATISFDADRNAIINFGEPGTLQYNASSPRFLNYTSNQQPVKLYVARQQEEPDPGVGVDTILTHDIIRVSGSDIIAPAGSRIYDLNGRRINSTGLQKGVYIVVAPGRTFKVFISK